MSPHARTDHLFSRLPVLETDRLLLRPVCPEDVDDLFALASDPLVTRYITWTTHRSREETSSLGREVGSCQTQRTPLTAPS